MDMADSAGTSLLTLTASSATFNGASVSMGALTATTETLSTYAFTSLPAGVLGMKAFVNNNSSGAAWGSTANGSGSTTYPVWYNGSAWIIG